MVTKTVAAVLITVICMSAAQAAPIVVYDRKLSDKVSLACKLAIDEQADVLAHKHDDNHRIRVMILVDMICGLKDQIRSPAKRD